MDGVGSRLAIDALYMSIVAAMIGADSLVNCGSKPSLRSHQSRIVWKMRCIDASSNGENAMML